MNGVFDNYGPARWLGLFLLNFVFLIACFLIVGGLVTSTFAMLVRLGAILPPDFLRNHYLWRAFAIGLLAGALPIELLLAGLGWLRPIRAKTNSTELSKKPKLWIWLPWSCWMGFGIIMWFRQSIDRSVLATHHLPSISDFRCVFFQAPCTNAWLVTHLDFSACSKQLEYTSFWVASIGYSSAALLPLLRTGFSELENHENSF